MFDLSLFLVITILTAWIVFFGGAEVLEGKIKSALFIDPNAPFWNATGIKLYVVISWLGSLFRVLVR